MLNTIEKHAFSNCHKLEEVRFSSCLEEICEGAFKNCMNLRHISFPPDSKLRIIGDRAFKKCKELDSFEFPPLLEFIGDQAFFGCNKIDKFDLRKNRIRHFGVDAFDCIESSTKTIYLPPTAILASFVDDYLCNVVVDESHPVVQRDRCGYYFSNGAIFQGDKKIERVLIRRGVERICTGCFSGSSLVSVTIPSSVTEIGGGAFDNCEKLLNIRFCKNSRLETIGEYAFHDCRSIKKIHFPKSLRTIKEEAFVWCLSLERVFFTQDSKLERIEGAFQRTAIKRFSLPPSVREIVDVSYNMEKLESMFVSNDLFQSNEEGSAIFSRDGSELVCVINSLKHFEIPNCVHVIKKRAFYDSSITNLTIPPSVEVIEEEAFQYCCDLIIDFQEGSRLKSLAFDAFDRIRDLIINNENFVKMENGVVMSMNSRGIVFVPRELTKLEIPPGVEVIYSSAFYKSKIKSLKFPKSLKKIFSNALIFSSLESVTFEDGTELDFIGDNIFGLKEFKTIKLPIIKAENGEFFLISHVIQFPPNQDPVNIELNIKANMIVCPVSSLKAISKFNFLDIGVLILENQ